MFSYNTSKQPPICCARLRRIGGWSLLAHIGLPLAFGIAFLIFSAAVLAAVAGWGVLVETAQDLAILGLGATGAIFDNVKVEQAFGANSALLAISVIAVNLIFSAIIVFMRAAGIKENTAFSFRSGIIALFFGFMTLVLTASVLVWAYRS